MSHSRTRSEHLLTTGGVSRYFICCNQVETPIDNCLYASPPSAYHRQSSRPPPRGPLLAVSVVPGHPGYLANLVTAATGCGGPSTPWHIAARPGQTVRLTLLDFSVARRRRQCLYDRWSETALEQADNDDDGVSAATACDALAIVREPTDPLDEAGRWRNATIGGLLGVGVGGGGGGGTPAGSSGYRRDIEAGDGSGARTTTLPGRETVVYSSTSHVIEVAILAVHGGDSDVDPDTYEMPHFMLKYEG